MKLLLATTIFFMVSRNNSKVKRARINIASQQIIVDMPSTQPASKASNMHASTAWVQRKVGEMKKKKKLGLLPAHSRSDFIPATEPC